MTEKTPDPQPVSTKTGKYEALVTLAKACEEEKADDDFMTERPDLFDTGRVTF